MVDMARKRSEAPADKKLCDVEGTIDDDYTNRFSEEILIKILSKLTLLEAASTSILARKWRSLWTHTTGSFDFTDEKTMAEFPSQPDDSITVKRTEFVTWVNQVMNQHKGSSIEELRICFDFDDSSTNELDSWISFAFKKHVQRLELDLSKYNNAYHAQPYQFPSAEKIAKILNLDNLIIFGCLRSLRLKHVNVTDKVLVNILDHCSFLECLCVEDVLCLKNALISLPNLKYLEICNCKDLLYMEVSAINLVSVKYFGAKMSINFKDVPRLSELYTGGDYSEYLMFEVPYTLDNLFQLETLKLCFPDQFIADYPDFYHNDLKHLEVILLPSSEFSLLRYTCLLEAFPSLTTFKMQLATREPFREFQPCFELRFLEQIARGYQNEPHPSLKVVELVNFAACPAEFDLACRLLEITPSLTKMIIQLKEGIQNLDDVIHRLRTLRTVLPPQAQLVILPVQLVILPVVAERT